MQPAYNAILACLLADPALSGTSTDYALEPAVFDGGSAVGTSADYALNPSMATGQTSSSGHYVLRGGFAGQLMDAASLSLAATAPVEQVEERATLQLEARIRFDDDSTAPSPLPAGQVAWTVTAGPLTAAGNEGEVTAGSVYQDTPASVSARYLTLGGSLDITVTNRTNDDFDIYASDGLPDPWQVRYFGPRGIPGGSGADYDSDGLTNLQEFAFGTDPTQPSGGAVLWNGSKLLAAGRPVPFATNSPNGFRFRAVYSRRKDFVAAGLSYTVEFSADLATWKSSTSTPSVLADDGEIQVVSVPYPFFVNGKKATYFRVRVESE